MKPEAGLTDIENPQFSLKKHRSIVHRTHLATAFQEKIFNSFLLAAKIALKTNQGNPDRFFKEGFRTSERYISNFASLKSNNRDYITSSIQSLQDHTLKFDFFDENDKVEVRHFAPISEVRYLEQGEVQFFLPPTIIELMMDPESSYTINTQLTNNLTSVYAIAIYELGIIHKDKKVEFKLQEFREFMGLKPDEYPTNNDLRRYVIERGCNEVNLKCDIEVKYSMIKRGQGNKVIGVALEFSSSTAPLEVDIPDQVQLELIASFCGALPPSLGGQLFVISILKKGLEEHGEAWVLSNVEAFVNRLNAHGQPPVKNLGALFRSYFQNDYGKELREAKAISKALEKQKKAKQAAPPAEDGAEAEKYLTYFEGLPENEQKKILAKMQKEPGLIGPEKMRLVYYLSEIMKVPK